MTDFPGHPLATDKTNATLRQDDHPLHHNDVAAAANWLSTNKADVAAIAGLDGLTPSLRRSGLWTFASHTSRAVSPVPVLNRVHYVPIRFTKQRTWEAIGCDVSTGIALGAFRTGLYEDDGNGWPGDVLYQVPAPLPATGIGFQQDATMSLPTAPGLYWTAFCAQGAAATFTTTTTYNERPSHIGAPGGTAVPGALYESGVTGALPATAAPTGELAACPVVFLLPA